ncbi:Protein of unknown function [Lachnospiraceae bacterium NE2001]|nr:Protein of unknown function [Lachnospiraceae bacterium NE2001]
MDKRKFIKKLEKNIGIKKVKNQIRAISALFVFLVIGGAFAIYMNHNGVWLSYGVIVAAVAMIILALFMSYRIKLQKRLNDIRLDYREYIVSPYAQRFFESGEFNIKKGPTEREIIATNMFSDDTHYRYTSSNELKGVHKNIKFMNADVFEDAVISEGNERSEVHIRGRFFEFDLDTQNINPVVLTSSSAPMLECQNGRIKPIQPKNDVVGRMFRVYAFDEKEANNLLTDNMIYKLRQLVGLQLGRIYKICFANGKTYVYFTTETSTYEEVLTKSHDVETELAKVRDKFSVVGKIIDIM